MNKINHILSYLILMALLHACAIPELTTKNVNTNTPEMYSNSKDSTNSVNKSWRDFFQDPYLIALIDTALSNNQELNIALQEVLISQNEIQEKKGEYLPFLNLGAGAGVEKVGRYTSQGANDANTDILPGKEFPEPLADFLLSANFSWEIDIWKKLRNAKKATALRYLSSVEGRNFITTKLVSEIAETYYELEALDNQLIILKENIEIQKNALEILKQRKLSGKVTELAVKRYEAEVAKNKSLIYYLEQKVVENENKINFLVGRFPTPIQRKSTTFMNLQCDTIYAGVPSQLLENRPDIKQAALLLEASNLDLKSVKANFYPSLEIRAGAGLQSFSLEYIASAPESIIFNLVGDLMAPLVNRNAIKAQYKSANNKQIQRIYEYEQKILQAYMEVANQVSNMDNLRKSFGLKTEQVNALNQSIMISNNLFKSARADYMEVLLTQRDALEARMELVETKMEQVHAMVNLYRALGGGWK